MIQTPDSLYLYCFARAGAGRVLSVTGLDGAEPVRALEFGDTAALFSPILLDEFQGESAEEHLRDPAWVVPRACQHERVIEAAMSCSPVLPARFGAVFSSREALLTLLAERQEEIGAFLDFAADKEEWGLKAFLDAERARSWLLESDPDLLERRQQLSASPGIRYFQEKRWRAEADRRVRLWSQRMADEIQRDVAANAADFRPLVLRPRSVSDRPGDLVLNCAFLVLRHRLAGFLGHAEALESRLAGQGLTLEFSGPWPPYNFCPTLDPRD